MKCKKHKKYMAILPPRVDCLCCYVMYEKTVMKKLEYVRDKIRELAYFYPKDKEN